MLTQLKADVHDLSRRSPAKTLALAAIVVLIVVDTWMSVAAGYRKGGGDLQAGAIGYALIMLAVALLASWVPWEAKHSSGRKAWGLWLLSLPLFFLVQSNGWAVMGVTVADGGVKRETAASGYSTVSERLKLERAELASLGVQRPIGQIKADLDLELRNTSRFYPKGDGPRATKLRGELAVAERAQELPRIIARTMTELADAPQVASGGVDRVVLMAALDWLKGKYMGRPLRAEEKATVEGTEGGMAVFLVALIGFWAVFGPALVLGIHKELPPAARDEPGARRALAAPSARRDRPPPDDAFGLADPPPPHDPSGGTPGAASAAAAAPTIPLMPAPAVAHGAPGGGSTNNIFVGPGSSPQQVLPPRVAARRSGMLIPARRF